MWLKLQKVQDENKTKIEFLVGTMIELPRAAIKAKDIAKHANFLVLEQMTYKQLLE